MKSRMEKYYNNEMENNERIQKNKKLYDTIYNFESLTNENDVVTANEMELNPNLSNSKSREEYRKLKEYQNILKKDRISINNNIELTSQEEKKVYDINSILEKARLERGIDEDEKENHRKLRNTQYDILNKLNLANKVSETLEETKSDEERLKELINTITMNKRVLNDLVKKDNGDLLFDLLPSENTLVSGSLTSCVIQEKTSSNDENEQESAKSFYTSAYDFNNSDFEEAKETENVGKLNNTLIKLLLFILIVIITTVVLFILNNYVDLNIFR